MQLFQLFLIRKARITPQHHQKTCFIYPAPFFATNPAMQGGQSAIILIDKKLAGREGYRLRIGGYRGIYRIEGEQVTVVVLDVGPRGGIYK